MTPSSAGRAPERHGPAWLVQAAHIARRSLVDRRSKIQIAEETGLSRFKVARILDEARDLGLVQVSVSVPGQIDVDLSSALTEAYGMRRAVVVKQVTNDETTLRDVVAAVGAEMVSEIVLDDDVLGLSCSRSVDALTRHLTTLAPCRVVQLTGTLAGADIDSGGVESVRRAAAVGGGKAFPIYAPMIVPDAATAAGLASQSGIAPVIAQFDEVTKAVIAVGAWMMGQSTIYAAVTEDERASGVAKGAVGEIGGRLFGADGRAVRTPVDDRVFGIELDCLRRIDDVVCLAFGRDRAAAVRAVVSAGVVNSLVCDTAMAGELLGAEAELDEPAGGG